MAAILTIFASFFRSALSISAFAHELGNVLEISVYLKEDADANVVKNRVKEFEHVENVTIIPKASSWSNLKREMDLPDMEIRFLIHFMLRLINQKILMLCLKMLNS